MKKIAEFFKKLKFDPNKTVNPVIAWCTFGGVLALSVVLALIFWL